MDHEENGDERHWTVDYRFPVAMVMTVAIQTVTLVAVGSWYLAELDGRVLTVERHMVDHPDVALSSRLTAMEMRQYAIDADTARFDEKLKAFDRQLQRFERILDKMTIEEFSK